MDLEYEFGIFCRYELIFISEYPFQVNFYLSDVLRVKSACITKMMCFGPDTI